MIENFRKLARTKVMQVILLTLVVAFMLSGLSAGVMSQATDNHIVKVAGEKIYPFQVQKELRDITRTLGEQNPGITLDDQTLGLLGITPQRILNDMMERKLLEAEVDELGLTVSDDLLRKQIVSSPEFKTDGKFDNELFKGFLYARGEREYDYLDKLRNQISSAALLNILFANIQTPNKIFEMEKNNATAKFDIEIAKVPSDFAALEKPPTDADLEEYLAVNSSLFRQAEQRTVSFIEVPKLEDARASLEMAEGIEDDIAGGATLAEIGASKNVDLQEKTFTERGVDPVAGKAYQLEEGDIELIEEESKYVVVELDDFKESYVPELDAIRADVAKEWKAAEKAKLSRQAALDFYDAANESNKLPETLKREKLHKLSAQEFAQKGYYALRGSNPTDAENGQVFGLYETLDGYAIARLQQKTFADLSEQELAALKQGVNQAYATELKQSYIRYLAGKYGVEFNEDEPSGNEAQ